MKIAMQGLMDKIDEIYACGLQVDGTHTRLVFSEEDNKGRALFLEYCKEIGMETRQDGAGNLIARMEGTDPAAPAIIMGSHLDTVPDGGKYDGVLGCLGGYAVCEALIRSGYQTKHPVEVIVFTDEEGARFGSSMYGSAAFCGEDVASTGLDLDGDGVSKREAMQSYGIVLEDAKGAKRKAETVHCFLELHVEQGASLDKKGIPVGIVSSIAGVSRYEIEVVGEANHAGSTMMEDRKDALVAAAMFIGKVPEIVGQCGTEYTVGTVGTMEVVPNAVNVIPGKCSFKLELRDQSAEVMAELEGKLRSALAEICRKSGMAYTFQQNNYHAPAPMTDWVKDAIGRAVGDVEHTILPSGAFHDALTIAGYFPTGMIFVPSVGGLSHCKQEYTAANDIEMGCNVLLQTILEIDG